MARKGTLEHEREEEVLYTEVRGRYFHGFPKDSDATLVLWPFDAERFETTNEHMTMLSYGQTRQHPVRGNCMKLLS